MPDPIPEEPGRGSVIGAAVFGTRGFRVFVTLLTFATIVYLLFLPIRSDDVFMYLALGRRFFAGGLPETDPFLFSMPNYHWHVWHEWGSYVLYYASYLIGGYEGPIALKDALIALMAGAAGFQFLRKRNFLFVPLVFVALYAGTQRFTEKASLFSELFSVLLIVLLLSRNESKRVWFGWVPGIFLLWINLHPGVPLGFLFFSLAIVSSSVLGDFSRAKLLAGSALASLAVCLANPEGVAGIVYPFDRIFDPGWRIFRSLFFEWRPTFTAGFAASAEVFALVVMWILALAAIARDFRSKPVMPALFLGAVVFLGADAIRFMLFSAMASLAIIANRAGDLRFSEKARGIGWGVVALVPVAIFFLVLAEGYPTFNGTFRPGRGFDERAVPEKAADFLDRSGVQGNMINETDWGSYFAWRWDGRRKVFYHGHIDDPNFLKNEYMRIYESQASFDELVEKHRIRLFVTQKMKLISENPRAISNLISHVDRDWKILYFDDLAAVLVRPE